MSKVQSLAEIVEYLAKVKLFAGVSSQPDALSVIAKIMKPRNFREGDKIIQQGQPGGEFFVLLDGQVAVYKETPDGDSYKVAVLTSKDYSSFGEGGLMEGEVRSATILSESSIQCLVLDHVDFSQFCMEYPQYAVPIIKKVAQSLMVRLNQTSHDMLLLHKALMSEIRSS